MKMINSNKLTQDKFNVMKNIIRYYAFYKGGKKSLLEKQLDSLRCKLTEEDYKDLKFAIEDYQDHILNILANSHRVFIKFNQQNNEDIDFDTLFEDI